MFGHNVRVLVTSLLDLDAYPAGDLGAFYHARWRIEETLKRIKHRLARNSCQAFPGWPHNKTSAQESSATTSMPWPSMLPVTGPNISARYFINRGDTVSRIKPPSDAGSSRASTLSTMSPPSSTN